MDYRKTTIAKNIRRLIDYHELSISEYARKANLAPATLTTFLKYPEERNISIDNLYRICDVGNIELWNLLIEDFPIMISRNKKITKITPEGYLLFHSFENAPPNARYSIMDAVALALSTTNKKTSSEIKEAQAKYNSTPNTSY